MCSRRKKEHQISCGDETGVYPDPAPKAYRFSMSILGHHLVENVILSNYKSVIIRFALNSEHVACAALFEIFAIGKGAWHRTQN